MAAPALSVVIPAYNEVACIERTIGEVRAELDRLVPSWEIVVVDDGSGDATASLARRAAAGDDRVRVIEAAHAGKGAAVRRGMLEAKGAWRFLADADLSMPIGELDRFLAVARTAAPDVIIGSREAAGSRRIDEPWIRHAIGRLFNWLVRIFVVGGIQDTQCGFKLFRGEAAAALFSRQTLDGFGFDVEILFLARRAGMTVHQIPITWVYGANSKVTSWSGLNGFFDLIRVRRNAFAGIYGERGAAGPQDNRDVGRVLLCGPAEPIDEPLSRPWVIAAWCVGAIMCATVCASLLRIPVQTTDSIVPLLQAQETPGVIAAVKGSMVSAAYLRPFRIGQIQILYELAKDDGRYFLIFRGFHAALVVGTFVLFMAALRVRTRDDFFYATFALTVMTGLHTFLGTVWEAYPINHFLEIAMFCLLALVLAQSRGGWWADVAAAFVFIVASMTLESGLLVWVVLVAARIVGLRGVSLAGLVAVTLLLCGYMYLRFASLGVGAPALTERASGFWTERLSTEELVERFGERPSVFYAYNVVSSWLSVLLSEPRAGTWAIPRQLSLTGSLQPGTLLNVLSSAVTTGLMFLVVVRRWREWLAGRFTRGDQLLLVMFAVLAGNGAISYGYTKDETMSAAGLFYAAAAFAAAREAVVWASTRRAALRLAIAALLLVTGAAWAMRTIGLHYQMRRMAYSATNEWVTVDRWLDEQGASPKTPEARRLVELLRNDAVDRPATPEYFLPSWGERWFQ